VASKKRTIPRGKLKKLAAALGGRTEIAAALGVSRPAVDRYFIGKGMRAETFANLNQLLAEHVNASRLPAEETAPAETLQDAADSGHLFALMARAVERGPGTDELLNQMTRMEHRQIRIEDNLAALLRAFHMAPV